MSNQVPLPRQLTNARVVLAAVLSAAVGVALLLVGNNFDPQHDHPWLQALLEQLGSLLIASVALYVLWELAAKRSFAQEILAYSRLSADIADSGVVRLGIDYKTLPDWPELFRRATTLDVFFLYGATWRASHDSKLKEMLQRSGTRVRICLPKLDPSDDSDLELLARRLGKNLDKVKTLITDAVTEFNALGDGRPGTIEVVQRSAPHVFAAYKFDDTIVVTMYSNVPGRVDVPTFLIRKPGTLYDFFETELSALFADKPVSDGAKPDVTREGDHKPS